jgi:hypothetical protein
MPICSTITIDQMDGDTYGTFDPLLRDRKDSRETLAFLALAAEPKPSHSSRPRGGRNTYPYCNAVRGLTSACACTE